MVDPKVQEEMDRGKYSSNKRGSVDNAGRLQAFIQKDKLGDATWGECDPERLQAVVHEITALGGAVTFGLSRDYGAHSLTLMLDSKRVPLWFNQGADIDEGLDGVLSTLETIKTTS